jgi:hypothetical protein
LGWAAADKTLALESLLLDEDFGTLDPAPEATALRTVQTRDDQIGLRVNHVQKETGPLPRDVEV